MGSLVALILWSMSLVKWDWCYTQQLGRPANLLLCLSGTIECASELLGLIAGNLKTEKLPTKLPAQTVSPALLCRWTDRWLGSLLEWRCQHGCRLCYAAAQVFWLGFIMGRTGGIFSPSQGFKFASQPGQGCITGSTASMACLPGTQIRQNCASSSLTRWSHQLDSLWLGIPHKYC